MFVWIWIHLLLNCSNWLFKLWDYMVGVGVTILKKTPKSEQHKEFFPLLALCDCTMIHKPSDDQTHCKQDNSLTTWWWESTLPQLSWPVQSLVFFATAGNNCGSGCRNYQRECRRGVNTSPRERSMCRGTMEGPGQWEAGHLWCWSMFPPQATKGKRASVVCEACCVLMKLHKIIQFLFPRFESQC